MYVEEINHHRAYQIMLNGHTSEDIHHIWANYAPCPNCVRSLITHFIKQTDKPVVHIARVIDYTENVTLTHVVDTLKCLAKLKYEEFDIQAFNFNEFQNRDPAFSESCNTLITTYEASANFTSAFMDLASHVSFIEQLREDAHTHSWCE